MIREEGGFYNRDPRDFDLRVALAYPAPYLASINSLGHQILYFLLNSIEGVMAERFVTDLRGSVESGRPLSDFDLVLATVHFEGQYPVLLRMLKGSSKPLVVGGPAVSANPIPMSEVATAIGIGDGEALIGPLIEALLRDDLESLADRGFFLPLLGNKARFSRIRQLKPLERQLLALRDGKPINQFLIEVSRGCGWGCRFCMLGWHWRPRLDLDPKSMESALDEAVNSGFRSVYVIGSDAASSRVLKDLLHMAVERELKVSLPSLRADQVDREIIELAASAGEEMLTLAPETGSIRMKATINKVIDNEEFVRVAQEAKESGVKHIKLYFIIGLPGEEDADVLESAKLASRVREYLDTKVTLSIFVPKAGTPFECAPLSNEEHIRRRFSLFRKEFRGKMNVMHYGRAYIQTFLSIGGFEVAKLLKKGYRIPFNRGSYTALARKLGIDLDRIVYGPRDTPWWDFVDTGVRRDYLREEFYKALRGEPTPGCDIMCTGCMRKCWILSFRTG